MTTRGSSALAATGALPLLLAALACGSAESRADARADSGAAASRATAAAATGAGVRLGEARMVSQATTVGTAPTFAVSDAGTGVVAWVSAPGGGSDGRLYVQVGDSAARELRDPLGPVIGYGEAPPKLSFGPDGSLSALYVIGRMIPGQKWPGSALRFVRSRDGGRTWDAPVTVTDDSTVFGDHNFAPDGAVYVSWLDGRGGKSAAYVTHSTDGGATWAPNRRIEPAGEACPCCRTAVATATDGTLYVAWRKVFPGNVRDVVVARSSDRGATWSAPVRAHADDWVFDACPDAGPALAVDDSGRVHVAWWTGLEGKAGVYYARSADGARTFGAPTSLGVARYSRPAHVQLALGGGTVAAAWDDGTRQIPQVVVRLSRDGGDSFGPAEPVSAAGRTGTFPVVALRERGLTLAWSEKPTEATRKQAHGGGLPNVGDTQIMLRRGTVE